MSMPAKHLEPDEVEQTYTTQLPPKMIVDLKVVAARRGMRIKDVVREYINHGLRADEEYLE